MARISRGFHGRRPQVDPDRVPPGQYVTRDFPVLSAGPTPHTALDEWTFAIRGAVENPASWSWEEFIALPSETFTVDIHCVTKWSKLDTTWTGVSLDTLLEQADPKAKFVLAFCDGGYTTNVPLADLVGGRAWIAYEYDGEPLEPEHGGPARLLVPHLYFWKSAKWVRGIELHDYDEPGFWRATATTTTATPGKSSAIGTTELARAGCGVAVRNRHRPDRREPASQDHRARSARLAGTCGRSARRRAPHRR